MSNNFQEIWIECPDNNGDLHHLTAKGWAKYQADRGNEKGNKASTNSLLKLDCGRIDIITSLSPSSIKCNLPTELISSSLITSIVGQSSSSGCTNLHIMQVKSIGVLIPTSNDARGGYLTQLAP